MDFVAKQSQIITPSAITHLYGVFPTLYALLIVTFSQELLCHAGSNAFLSQLTRTLANTACDSEYLHTALTYSVQIYSGVEVTCRTCLHQGDILTNERTDGLEMDQSEARTGGLCPCHV